MSESRQPTLEDVLASMDDDFVLKTMVRIGADTMSVMFADAPPRIQAMRDKMKRLLAASIAMEKVLDDALLTIAYFTEEHPDADKAEALKIIGDKIRPVLKQTGALS